ncbi:TraB/GumN family protein [Pelagerythrobacter rhizovicinus]|uniref:TraB/GumN family protein n=1 Tax=Pelagerythrobacter rhizovicinus TaxID=2268576 RepID=A0A4Q2KLI9_9SPHN|nr:TraB/GumN family protein [Pelagerythrobacter rhizovicinus]RXZ66174.1 TraB/GumN family protein [Pelagerythrobacter rhizovicinus]
MRGVALALAAPLALAACGTADPPPGFDGPPSPALFEISSPDGAVEGWMFGTIHSLPDGVAWQTEALDGALARADLLVVEVRDLDDPAALYEVFAARAYAAGEPPLPAKLPAALRRDLFAILAEHDVTADAFAGMETWAAALTLAQHAETGDAANGVDRALLARVPRENVVELEGAARQLDVFDRLPEAEQRDLLAAVVADMVRHGDDPARHARAWYEGRIDHLADPATSAILADPELREALYAGRNRDWAVRLTELLADDPRPFVAVGSAHLAGEDGLPALLAARGYTVRRIQ